MVIFFVFFLGFSVVFGHPIDPKDLQSGNIAVALVALAFLVTGVLSVALCLCCKKRQDGFKEFTNPRSSNVGFTNTLATEVAIFPPPGALLQRQEVTSMPPVTNLPPSKPPRSIQTPEVSDWFADENENFPRQQISYKKEMGTGWFGKVMEGETRGTKVAIRILKEGCSPEEKSYFLNEAKPFRDLRHKNVAKLYGRCLEQEPYLLIFELVNNRDLKNFLTVNSNSKAAMFEQGICLKLMTDVSEGLDFMNKNGFIHSDLAARNCLVGGDLSVRIGDYGTSVDLYKNEYYHVDGIAVPIRWCAPETVNFTSSSIETKEVTVSANIWSLGVILWEIAEFGRLPFDSLSDDEVISKVFGQERLRLPQPECPSGQYLHNIMQICWKMENRATTEQVISMLQYLKMNPFQESDFESRWKKLKPNTVAVVDNHTPIHSPRHTELAQRLKLQAKTEFDSGVDLEIKPDDSFKTSSPTISPQLSVMSDDFLQKKSPSLTNLKGSLEDVQYDSWLQGVEQKTDEDRTFVKNISEAIKNLDETLALEKTSSSSPDSSIECPKKPLFEFNLGPTSLEREFNSDTEEEAWRNRIERGEFTEKVKEKSKSVTDLMILTHIESEESENDSLPSLSRQYAKKNAKITIFTGIGFSSEGNIRNALLREEFEEKLKSLNVRKTDDSLGKESFLVNAASGTISKETVNKNIESEAAKQSSQEESVPKIVITESVFEERVEDEDQIEVRFEPRKFVFVCHESDSEDENCDKESSVILGSCEEHTLDFFKGLKTTYADYYVEEAKILDEPKKEPKRPTSTKVSKSKSLDSVLDNPEVAEHFDSFSGDSGHSSDRCIDQDKQMNDLKSRLEDVMRYGDDFQLRSSEDEYGGKLLTPDDERSSDSGFRDKGSLSESVEDTCDEKYNLEDIDAELDDYHVNEFESQSIESWFLHPKETKDGWGSISTENEEQTTFSIDAEFVAAIRNELSEKLPCAHQKTEEDTSPEETADPIFVYPSQLSPILEEHESSQSSLIDDDSPLLILPPPEIPYDTFKEDIIKEIIKSPDKEPLVVEDLENGEETLLPEDKFMIEDDVLIIDTETNEVTLIESPKPQSHLAFVLPKRNENFDDDSVNSETYILSPENAPTPDISYDNTLSSPENMSGLYMSPCSVRSDLFDSGPPSLPFDLGQSMEEVEEITPNNEAEEIMQDLISAGIVQPVIVVEETPDHKKAELEIDLLLQKPKKMEEVRDQTWLKDLLSYDLNVSENWPSSEELEGEKLKPNLNSTLALLSPDEKNQSSSSFASTPDDSKLILDSLSDSSNYSVIAAPTSLSIGNSVTVPMPSPEDADKGWRPTMCQLMELTDQAEGEEMTTSFIEPDENGVYTPDWESDTSESSSSGEFVWKEGVKDDVVDTICLIQEPSKMERIDEEDENTTDTDDTDSEGSGTEFVPSTWDPNATPGKSSLKSPTSKSSRKRVVFEKEKYQCVYKYPREPVEEEEPTPTPSTEYSTFNDTIMDDGEFFISGSSRGFDWGESERSEFFPGRDSEEADFASGSSESGRLNLGELRHTKDTLRLELPTLSRHVEKAEASFLDSGIDTATPDKN